MLRLLVVLLGILVVLFLLRLTRPPQALRATGPSADSAPQRATSRRHTEALAAARENLQHAEAAHARAVSAAEGRFIDAGLDLPVTSLGRLHLGRLTLTVDDRQHWLDAHTRAEVDVVGEVGEVRVVVHAAGWREEQTVTADQLEQAQRFVSATESTVGTLDQARTDRHRRISVAIEELESTRGDTQELDRARMTVEDLEGAGPLRRDLPPAPQPPENDDPENDERA